MPESNRNMLTPSDLYSTEAFKFEFDVDGTIGGKVEGRVEDGRQDEAGPEEQPITQDHEGAERAGGAGGEGEPKNWEEFINDPRNAEDLALVHFLEIMAGLQGTIDRGWFLVLGGTHLQNEIKRGFWGVEGRDGGERYERARVLIMLRRASGLPDEDWYPLAELPPRRPQR